MGPSIPSTAAPEADLDAEPGSHRGSPRGPTVVPYRGAAEADVEDGAEAEAEEDAEAGADDGAPPAPPVLVFRKTREPGAASLPAEGSCPTIMPAGAVSLDASSTPPSANPASSRARSASE